MNLLCAVYSLAEVGVAPVNKRAVRNSSWGNLSVSTVTAGITVLGVYQRANKQPLRGSFLLKSNVVLWCLG